MGGICVECGKPVNQTYKQFSKGNIRLTHCDYCKQVADKYVEYDFVIISLDLILHRAQVYRHILFNMTDCDNGISVQYLKVFVVYLFFEAYCLREKMTDEIARSNYLLLLLTVFLEFMAFVAAICLCVRATVRPAIPEYQYAIIKYNYLVMALILASFGKGFVSLMMIWDYNTVFSSFGFIIDVFVLTSCTLAVKVFLECTTLRAATLVGIGLLAKLILRFGLWLAGPVPLCMLDLCLPLP